jgi:hypothetical protein
VTTLLFTFAALCLVTLALAIGVIAGRKPLQGSCGGLAGATREDCPVCGGDNARCATAGSGGVQSQPAASEAKRDG